jgi:hypothetical protein
MAPLGPVTGAGAREVCGPLSGTRGRGRAAVKAAGGATGAWLCGALVAMLGRDAPVLGGALRGAPLAPGAVVMMSQGTLALGASPNASLAPITGAGAKKVPRPLCGGRGRGRAAVRGAGGATVAWRCGALATMAEGRGAPEGAPKNAPLASMTGAGARKGLSVPWRGERGRGHAAVGGAGRATGAWRCGTMVTMSE